MFGMDYAVIRARLRRAFHAAGDGRRAAHGPLPLIGPHPDAVARDIRQQILDSTPRATGDDAAPGIAARICG